MGRQDFHQDDTRAPAAVLDLVTFSQLTDIRPVAQKRSWERLARRLGQHAERHMKDGPGWSPVVYRQDATRGGAGVVSVSAVVLDVDHAEPLWSLLDGLEYVAHTTWSHQVSPDDDPDGHPSCAPGGDPHWRIVLPLAKPVLADEWDEFRARVRFWLCPNADEAAKDGPRFFWQPACRPDQPRETRRHVGRWLDPAELRPIPDGPTTPEPVEPHRNGTSGERPGDRYTRETDWLDILEPRGWVVVGSSRDNLLLRRPGKRIGHSATISQHGAGVLFMFSSSAAPFEPERWYSKFAAFALLEHGGDLATAARALAERYGLLDAHRRSSSSSRAGAAPADEPRPSSDEPSPAGTLTLRGARLIRLSEVIAVPVAWLWRGYIPAGKLTMIDGDPGLGKSCLTTDLAARVSTGSPMPDGTLSGLDGPGGCVIMSAEDGLDDTIRPRLDAAGADPARIVALTAVRPEPGQPERLPTLADLAAIEDAILHVGARLVVIDPFMAYLPDKVDSHKDQAVRSVLAQLKAMGERTGAAMALVRHLSKSQSSAIYRGGGSIGIIGAARSGLVVAKDPDDETGTRRIIAPTKANLSAPVSALAYRILGTGGLIDTARIAWEGPTSHTADGLLAEPEPSEERSQTADAMAWLHALLLKGKRPARSVQRAGSAAEISVKVLRRARERLAVRVEREGFGSGSRSLWSLAVDALSFHKCPSCLCGDNKGIYVPVGIYGSENDTENEADEADEADE